MTNIKPLNIVLIGDPGTGKTNLLSRLLKNHFNHKYEPTIGINGITYVIHEREETNIWDLAGQEKYRRLADALLCDADGVLLVYDVSNPATFEHLGAWLKHIRQAASSTTVIKLVGNKNDLQINVPRKKAEQFAADNGLSYIETSALNDTHVHLAFESIAQEIHVATHSVSEPIGSFVQKLKASSDDQQEKPFQIVLVDIEQAAIDNKIVCVEKPLDEANLEFIAISYRWGEVQEQVVDTYLGYTASVTSFDLKDFCKLCLDIIIEPDLQSIKYVWVDAICVDQNNHDRRKATIYQMSNIYHRASYILAVPDLHLEYLRSNQIFHSELEDNLYNIQNFIYYVLQEESDQLVQITEKWLDEMNIPKGAMARDELTSYYRKKRFTNYLDVYNEQVAHKCPPFCQHSCYDECSQESYHTYKLDCHDTPKAMLDHIQYAINECHYHSENTTIVYENTDCALCSLQMDMCKHRKRRNKNETIPDYSDQKWLACVLREFRYDKYRGLVADRAKAVAKVIKYLEYLIKDWSSRVWVISEYNIAKAKQFRKLKFWFLSLKLDFNLEDSFKKLGFFVFDFDKTNIINVFPGYDSSFNYVLSNANTTYCSFQRTLRSQLNERSFLDMMLNSKASRNEDRFYAILPSSKYKSILTSREVVSSWQIDNIVSVKLKLFELLTIKDKLDLLYRMAYSNLESQCTFPAFATINMDKSTVPPVEERNERDQLCNFDLNNNATLRLVPPMGNENGHHFHKLNLSPKTYYVIRLDEIRPIEVRRGKAQFFDTNERFWQTLEINYVDDDMVYVKIPMYMAYSFWTFTPTDIVLFGSFKKNKWLLCRTRVANNVIKRFPFKEYDNSDGNISFDIY